MRPGTAVPPLSGLGLEGGTAFQSGSCKTKSVFAFHLYLGKCVGKPLNLLLESLKIVLESYKMGSNFGPQLGTPKRRDRKVQMGTILGIFLLKVVLGGLHERPRAIPTLCFGSNNAPRALQEASKRLPEGFRVEDAIRVQFLTYFWL